LKEAKPGPEEIPGSRLVSFARLSESKAASRLVWFVKTTSVCFAKKMTLL
jgi:hypothetical protein